MSLIRKPMNKLVEWINDRIQAGVTDHCDLCNEAADQFDLWEPDGTGAAIFPVWLSRVVEGELADAKEK